MAFWGSFCLFHVFQEKFIGNLLFLHVFQKSGSITTIKTEGISPKCCMEKKKIKEPLDCVGSCLPSKRSSLVK